MLTLSTVGTLMLAAVATLMLAAVALTPALAPKTSTILTFVARIAMLALNAVTFSRLTFIGSS